jgi:peptide/nickel transport system substrate-binding protein
LQKSINLPDIAKNYYLGTVLPNPTGWISNYMTGWGYQYSDWPQSLKDEYAWDPAAAKQLLTAAGYPTGFDTDIVVDTNSDMGLLEIIKSDFAAINVNMSIQTMDNASWQSYVALGHKQDALASLSTGGITGQAVEPIISLNKFVTSLQGSDWLMVRDPMFDTLYNNAVAAIDEDQVKAAVKAGGEYFVRQHVTISLLQPILYTLVQPWLKGHAGQYGATYGSWGPSYLFFYGARFWIDQSLKK